MLNNNWIISLTSMLVANLNTSLTGYAQSSEDPIAAILELNESTTVSPKVDISYGWIQLNGLPNESLEWNDVDAEFIYVIQVANNTMQPIGDRDLELAEILPEGVILNSKDYDGAGPIRTSFEFVSGDSGVIILPEDISYSDDFGDSYGYQPAANGYDEAIGAIRIKPKGVMAPNSSFMIRFRVRVR